MNSSDFASTVELERTELLMPTPAMAFAGLLGVEAPNLDQGDPLPLLWHWLYTLERSAQADIGSDGHPVRGVIPAPPGPGRRRMWAGGRVTTLARLRAGEKVTRYTRLLDEVTKEGRSGQLTFVTVQHELMQRNRVAVRERQDIVYRDAQPTAVTTAPQPVTEIPLEAGEWDIPIDPVLLFRFSALTYNGHRIHYDREYATQVEGYPGLVTHGPLQALAMAEAARRSGIDASVGTQLDYRLVSPLYDYEGLVTSCLPDFRGGAELRARDRGGRTTATARLIRL